MVKSGRFWHLDLLRSMAVLGMIIFHAFFILDFYGVIESSMRIGLWHAFGQVVRYIFLGLVGVGMVISYRRVVGSQEGLLFRERVKRKWKAIRWQWRRAVVAFAGGFLVSLVTSVALPEDYVKFGILHLIGVSIFVLSFLMWNRWLILMAAVLAYWLGYFGNDGQYFLFARDLGFKSIDYFPLFPWMGVVALGIFLADLVYGKVKFLVFDGLEGNFFVEILSFLGRHSLLIYLIHVPILVGIFLIFGVLDFSIM